MPIELAVLGCEHRHLADVLGVVVGEPDLRLAAAWDRDPDRVPGPIAAAAVRDVDRAIARADAVVVLAGIEERPALCARAARAGRPVLVEVPVAADAREAALLARELARSRTPALALLHLRELAALQRLRSTLASGHLGRPATVRASLADDRAAAHGTGRRSGRRAWPDPGGFLELGIHLLDALGRLGEVPRLTAATLDRASGGGDVGGVALGRLGGVPLTFAVTGAVGSPAFEIAVEGARRGARLRDGTLELHEGVGASERWIGGPPDPGEAVRAFAEGLRRQSLPRDGLAGAIRAQLALERAARID